MSVNQQAQLLATDGLIRPIGDGIFAKEYDDLLNLELEVQEELNLELEISE